MSLRDNITYPWSNDQSQGQNVWSYNAQKTPSLYIHHCTSNSICWLIPSIRSTQEELIKKYRVLNWRGMTLITEYTDRALNIHFSTEIRLWSQGLSLKFCNGGGYFTLIIFFNCLLRLMQSGRLLKNDWTSFESYMWLNRLLAFATNTCSVPLWLLSKYVLILLRRKSF